MWSHELFKLCCSSSHIPGERMSRNVTTFKTFHCLWYAICLDTRFLDGIWFHTWGSSERIFHGIKKNLLLIHHFFFIWFRARSNQLDHNSKMLSNLNHDHGRKKKFETWKEKIEKKWQIKTKFPDLIFVFQPFSVFWVPGKLGCLHPLHSKHLKTQNSLKDWPFSYTKWPKPCHTWFHLLSWFC